MSTEKGLAGQTNQQDTANRSAKNQSATGRRALVVGLGISGIASAIALKQSGWEPVIVEKAPARRRGGYFIGLFGLGRIAADHLGALPGLHDRRSPASQNFAIDRTGIIGDTLGFADAPADFGPWMMLRGDVEQATFDALPDDVEIRYNTRPVDVWQNASGVRVTLEDSATGERTQEEYELLVGADGIHSQVREMVFGPAQKYLHELGTMICAFELPENPPGLKPDQGVILTEVGKAFWVFPFADHPATVLFTWASDDPGAERKLDPKQHIREVFGDQPFGAYMEYALDQLDRADEFLYDTTEQVKMDSWHRGRVVLVGDSAWCPTLYSGMGATSGIGGADLLGAALRKHPDDLDAALDGWEKVMRPKIANFQKEGATQGRKNFVSLTQAELDKRNKSVGQRRKMIKNPIVGRLLKHVPMIRNRNADLTALL
jgi:2-polyprenyl-6-methoxyphenol hydroxylase-like FAD-dependent oxidoreductase